MVTACGSCCSGTLPLAAFCFDYSGLAIKNNTTKVLGLGSIVDEAGHLQGKKVSALQSRR